MNKKRNNRGRFTKKVTPDKSKPSEEKAPKAKTRPKRKSSDFGDDAETLEILRIGNVTTVTARNESGRVVKAFVADASLYQVGKKHDFRVARNGAYHEIEPPPPKKKYMDYSEYIRT